MERECIFQNKFLPPEEDTNPCLGRMTRHHVLFKSEGGVMGPTVPMCEGHQYFVHSTNTWGDEDFDSLIPRTKNPKPTHFFKNNWIETEVVPHGDDPNVARPPFLPLPE